MVSRRMAGIIWAGLNITTESLDILDAFYNALPDGYFVRTYRIYGNYGRPGQEWADPTPQQKWAYVLKHWGKIEIEQLVLNLNANHFTDKLVGAAGKPTIEMGQFLGLNHSLEIGPAL